MTGLFAWTRSPDEAARLRASGFDGTAAVEGGHVLLDAFSGARHRFRHLLDDRPTPAVLDRAAAEDEAGVLLDASGRLVDDHGPAALEAVREQCAARGLSCGFSGGLEAPDLPRLLALAPDILVVGGALRRGGDPAAPIDPECAALLRALVPAGGEASVSASVGGATRPDRIFVRDLVLPVAIGAYDSERGRRQDVRFSVEAELRGTGRPTSDMRDVVSYDLIIDAIGALTAERHVDFVETLAEAIAARVLVHPRILVVRVTVEKLEVGPGSVGVCIERRRA